MFTKTAIPKSVNKPTENEANKKPFFAGRQSSGAPFFSADPSSVQPKLTINAPGDKYEQEADEMAERVVQAQSIQRQSLPEEEEELMQAKPLGGATVQRKCAACEQEATLQRQAEPEEEELMQAKRQETATVQRQCAACGTVATLQRQAEPEEEELMQAKPLMRASENGTATATPQLASQLNSSKGGGQPLPKDTLSSMNNIFGADFSGVRVHTGSRAQEMSQGIQARAFTHGSDIYFNEGNYNPDSLNGKKLITHELTHTLQQGSVPRKNQHNESSIKSSNQLSDTIQRWVRRRHGRPIVKQDDFFVPESRSEFRQALIDFIRPIVVTEEAPRHETLIDNAESIALMNTLRRQAGTTITLRVQFIWGPNRIESVNFILPQRPILITGDVPSEGIEEERTPVPSSQTEEGCGAFQAWFRHILFIDEGISSDLFTCGCLGVGFADLIPVPAIGTNPWVEGLDCVCNIYTLAQEIYRRGTPDGANRGCWSLENLTSEDIANITILAELVIADCGSLPIGAFVGGLLGASTGSAAGPGGTIGGGAAGAVLGDFIVDTTAMFAQNLITHDGTTIAPENQLSACRRIIERL